MKNVVPRIHCSAYISPRASIIGDVTIEEGVSVWEFAVLRGDVNSIYVGKNSNIQDCAVIHVSENSPTIIGESVTVGHCAVVHGAKIENNVIVGIGAIVLDNAEIGEGSIIGAGAVVTPNTKIPPRSLALGVPAKVVKTGEEFLEMAIRNSMVYQRLRDEYLKNIYVRYDKD